MIPPSLLLLRLHFFPEWRIHIPCSMRHLRSLLLLLSFWVLFITRAAVVCAYAYMSVRLSGGSGVIWMDEWHLWVSCCADDHDAWCTMQDPSLSLHTLRYFLIALFLVSLWFDLIKSNFNNVDLIYLYLGYGTRTKSEWMCFFLGPRCLFWRREGRDCYHDH